MQHMQGASRTKRMAACKAIAAGEWTDERSAAWDAMRDSLANLVKMGHRRAGWKALFLTSKLFWGCALTHLPAAQNDGSLAVCITDHNPVGF